MRIDVLNSEGRHVGAFNVNEQSGSVSIVEAEPSLKSFLDRFANGFITVATAYADDGSTGSVDEISLPNDSGFKAIVMRFLGLRGFVPVFPL